MRIVRTVAVLVLALAFVMSLTGCELIAKKAIEGATGVSVDDENGGVTIETPEGKASTTEGKLPDGFPAEVPVYQPSTVQSGIMTDGDQGKTYMVGLLTDDAGNDVAAWYKAELEKAGWKITTTADMGTGGSLTNASNGTIDLMIVIGEGSGEDAGKTAIQLATTPAKK